MSNKYIRLLRRMALDGNLDAKTAEVLLEARDAGRFVEGVHPRDENGRFTYGGGGGGKSESPSESSGSSAPKAPKKSSPKTAPKAAPRIKTSETGNGKKVSLEGVEANKVAESITKPSDLKGREIVFNDRFLYFSIIAG